MSEQVTDSQGLSSMELLCMWWLRKKNAFTCDKQREITTVH
jgi:hypothetical protein